MMMLHCLGWRGGHEKYTSIVIVYKEIDRWVSIGAGRGYRLALVPVCMSSGI